MDTVIDNRKQYDLFFSQSRYNLMNDCLGKYYFQYIENVKIPFNIWPATLFGQVVHVVIEQVTEKYKTDESFKNGIDKYREGILTKSPADKIVPELFTKEYELQYKKEVKEKRFKESRGYDYDKTISDGQKWIKKVIDFMVIHVGFDGVESEMKITSDIDEYKMRITSYLDLVKITDDNVFIFDMKNTKHPQKFYFKNWDKDIQSNIYIALLLREKKLKAKYFSYLVFSMEEAMIFANSVELSEENREKANVLLDNLTKRFYKLHQKAKDVSLWSPSAERCKWCEVKKVCKVKQ